MATNTRAYFIILTADDCPVCITFKTNIKAMVTTAISSIPGVKVVDINVTRKDDANELAKYHPDLPNKAHWVPTFLLLNNSWMNKSQALEGVFFNGEILPEIKLKNGNSVPNITRIVSLKHPSKHLKINQVELTTWVQQELANNPDLFSPDRTAPSSNSLQSINNQLLPSNFNYLSAITSSNKLSPNVVIVDSKAGQRCPIYGDRGIKFGSAIDEEVFAYCPKGW